MEYTQLNRFRISIREMMIKHYAKFNWQQNSIILILSGFHLSSSTTDLQQQRMLTIFSRYNSCWIEGFEMTEEIKVKRRISEHESRPHIAEIETEDIEELTQESTTSSTSNTDEDDSPTVESVAVSSSQEDQTPELTPPRIVPPRNPNRDQVSVNQPTLDLHQPQDVSRYLSLPEVEDAVSVYTPDLVTIIDKDIFRDTL